MVNLALLSRADRRKEQLKVSRIKLWNETEHEARRRNLKKYIYTMSVLVP